jgi:CheY-like chemotaxis protein
MYFPAIGFPHSLAHRLQPQYRHNPNHKSDFPVLPTSSLRDNRAKGTFLSEVPHILVVEDNPGDVMLVKLALSESEVQGSVEVITTGQDATRRLCADEESVCPSLVLLDLNLPGGDGLEVLTKIRTESNCRDVPVIVFTSSPVPRDLTRAEQLGITYYFRKTHALQEFLKLGDLVRCVLNNS